MIKMSSLKKIHSAHKEWKRERWHIQRNEMSLENVPEEAQISDLLDQDCEPTVLKMLQELRWGSDHGSRSRKKMKIL